VSETPLSSAELAELRRAYVGLLGPGSPACPDTETLAAGVLGELTEEERLRVADHVIGCRRCAEDWRLLQETHASVSPRQSRRHPISIVVAAAAMLLVAAGVLLVSRRGAASHEAMRGNAAETRAADAALSPKSGSRLEAPPGELAWRAPSDATRQRARLFDAAGRLVWQEEAGTVSRAAIPDSVRSGLPDGDYFWTVELETGDAPTKLGPFPFRIARR
jgi:hypothetical protein